MIYVSLVKQTSRYQLRNLLGLQLHMNEPRNEIDRKNIKTLQAKTLISHYPKYYLSTPSLRH